MKLHDEPMKDELFEQIKRDGIDTFARNELSMFTLDTLGVLIMRATFAYFPELNELPVIGEGETGSEVCTRTAYKDLNSKLLFDKNYFERMLRNVAKACTEINKPVMPGTLKVSVAFGAHDNELMIRLIWVQ